MRNALKFLEDTWGKDWPVVVGTFLIVILMLVLGFSGELP